MSLPPCANNPIQVTKIYSAHEISHAQKTKGRFISPNAYRIEFTELTNRKNAPATMIAVKAMKDLKYNSKGQIRFNCYDTQRFFPLLIEDQEQSKVYIVGVNINSLVKRIGQTPSIKQKLKSAIKTRHSAAIENAIQNAIDIIRQQPMHKQSSSPTQPLLKGRHKKNDPDSSDSPDEGKTPSRQNNRSLPLRYLRASGGFHFPFSDTSSDSDSDVDFDPDDALFFPMTQQEQPPSLLAALFPPSDLRGKKGPKEVAEYLEANRRFAAAQQKKKRKPYHFLVNPRSDLPNTMDIAVTEGKESFIKTVELNGETKQINGKTIGISWCIGRRPYMEDVHLATTVLFELQGKTSSFELFGVFDGHLGPDAAIFVKDNIGEYLANALNRDSQNPLTDDNIVYAIESGCLELNANYQKSSGSGGTTAAFVVIFPEIDSKKIWVVNVGDSRVVLVSQEAITQASEDAKPEIRRYRKEIEALGGHVGKIPGEVYRVNTEHLAMGTAFGDFHILGSTGTCCISAKPEITCYDWQGEIILATDGLFDVASSDQVGSEVRYMVDATPEEKAKHLVQAAINYKSYDNVTVMIIKQ